jgi:hypothetical protein
MEVVPYLSGGDIGEYQRSYPDGKLHVYALAAFSLAVVSLIRKFAIDGEFCCPSVVSGKQGSQDHERHYLV